MRKILYFIMCLPILLLSACDVHEWPETPEFVKMHLRLNYETDMTEWEHLYDGAEVIEQGYGETYDNHRDYGKIRYIVRTYPVSRKCVPHRIIHRSSYSRKIYQRATTMK